MRLVLHKTYDTQDCSAARALEIVGERWSLLILRDAMFRGYTRYSQFQRSLGVATNVLAARLDDFVAAGLMERRGDGTAGDPVEYVLTRKGLEIKPVIVALTEWGDRWVRPGPVEFRSAPDGQPVALELRRADDARLDVADVVAKRR